MSTHRPRRPRPQAFNLDQPPAYIGARQFAKLLELGPSAFYRHAKAGRFNWALLRPRVGQQRYSGARIAAWLKGEVMPMTATTRRRA